MTIRQLLATTATLLLASAPILHAQFTESPATTAPGTLRFEIDALRLSLNREGSEKARGVAIASSLLSTGLTSSVDLQVGIDTFLQERVDYRGGHDTRTGLGDMTFRAKWCFWNDEKVGAAAIIPFVIVPTAGAGLGTPSTTGGIIVPWERKLSEGLTLGAMAQWTRQRNDADTGYGSAWSVTAVLNQEITSALSIYAETTLDTAGSLANGSGSGGVGALWQVTKRLQLDYEVLRGIGGRSTDWTHVWRVNWDW